MKRVITLVLALCLLAVSLSVLTACAAQAGVVTLYVYNWGEYISDGSEGSLNVNAAFEDWYYRETGKRVKVNYSTYSSNEDMYAKISSGATNYDVIFPSDYMIARMIKDDLLAPLNYANIPNHGYIDYSLMFGEGNAPSYDPEVQYSVPYTYGTIGIIYNKTMVDEADVTSWDVMWNEKYKGQILQFNNPRDAFATALFKLGYSINTESEQEWREALELLKAQKDLVQAYVMDEIFDKMKNGSAAIAPYYAGDFFSMQEDNPDLGFAYPQGQATNIFVDAMCVPKGSQNQALAECYINFMLSREIAIANAEYISYASPNRLVFDDPQYREDMGEEAMDILYEQMKTMDPKPELYENLDDERQVLLNSLWEDLKIKSPVNTAIIVTAAVILGGVLTFGILGAVRARRRKKILETLWD